MATRRIGLNGSRIHIAFVAENLNMSFPLLMTTKVCEQIRRSKCLLHRAERSVRVEVGFTRKARSWFHRAAESRLPDSTKDSKNRAKVFFFFFFFCRRLPSTHCTRLIITRRHSASLLCRHADRPYSRAITALPESCTKAITRHSKRKFENSHAASAMGRTSISLHTEEYKKKCYTCFSGVS